jgi:hypothetical protein
VFRPPSARTARTSRYGVGKIRAVTAPGEAPLDEVVLLAELDAVRAALRPVETAAQIEGIAGR